jgi:hypothetical protein
MGRGEVRTGFWWGSLKVRDHLEDPGINDKIILNCIIKKWVGEVWTGLICLRIGTGNGRL